MCGARKYPLIRQIVNREQCFCLFKERIAAIQRVQVKRYQRSLPIVAVNDLAAAVALAWQTPKRPEIAKRNAPRCQDNPARVPIQFLTVIVTPDNRSEKNEHHRPAPLRGSRKTSGCFPSGIVKLGSSVLRDLTPRYLGIRTTASCPSCRMNFGSAPTTSASPPVLAKGTASEATYSTRMTV